MTRCDEAVYSLRYVKKAHYGHYTAATGFLLILPHIDLTSQEHGGLMAQLFHFLGKQGVHLTLQGAYSPLAAVVDRT